MSVSDSNNPARQSGANQLGQDNCKDVATLLEDAANGDASSGETTTGERNERDGLAGAEGKDVESLLKNRLIGVEDEILARIEEHSNLLDRLGELKAAAFPSSFSPTQGRGSHGVEEREIGADTKTIVSTAPAAGGLVEGAPAQGDPKRIEPPARPNEPADLISLTGSADEQPAEGDRDSSSVTLDNDGPAPAGQETQLNTRTKDGQLAVGAGNGTPTGPPSITSTIQADNDNATKDSEAMKVKRKSKKRKIKDRHKRNQKIRRELKEMHGDSLKELEENREMLQTSHRDLATLQERLKRCDQEVFYPMAFSPGLYWHVVGFYPVFMMLIEDIKTYHNAIDRLYTLNSDVDPSFLKRLHGHAHRRLPEWREGVQVVLQPGSLLERYIHLLYRYQNDLISYLDCLQAHKSAVDEVFANSPRHLFQGQIEWSLACPKINGGDYLLFLGYCTDRMADLAMEME